MYKLAKEAIIQRKSILSQKLKNQQKEKKPMAYKKYREMKVDIGEQIEVKCEDGRLIITKANEIWSAEA